MYNFAKLTLIALGLAIWSPAADAILPLADRVRGEVQQRPFCPARPASPEFQRDLFIEFVNEFINEPGLITKALEDFLSEDYIQHNPYVLSGRDNAIAALGGGFPGANFTILQTIFESPYGTIRYKLELPGQPPLAIQDLWRFNGTCIEEHWDTTQALPANATNPLALF